MSMQDGSAGAGADARWRLGGTRKFWRRVAWVKRSSPSSSESAASTPGGTNAVNGMDERTDVELNVGP